MDLSAEGVDGHAGHGDGVGVWGEEQARFRGEGGEADDEVGAAGEDFGGLEEGVGKFFLDPAGQPFDAICFSGVRGAGVVLGIHTGDLDELLAKLTGEARRGVQHELAGGRGGEQPLDETGDAFGDRGSGIVAEVLAGLGDVGKGDGHVARLFGENLDEGFFAEGVFECADQFGEGSGLAFAEVEDVEGGALVVESGEDALEDVVDEGVVAPGGAIAELLDGAAL